MEATESALEAQSSTEEKSFSSSLPTRKLDTRGLVCPYPAFETSKLIGNAGKDEVLEIISDDKYVALNSIPTVLRTKNYEYFVRQIDDGSWSIKAKRSK